MDVTKPYKFIGFGAMEGTKPYKFKGFGAIEVTKPNKCIGFVTIGITWGVCWAAAPKIRGRSKHRARNPYPTPHMYIVWGRSKRLTHVCVFTYLRLTR